jgi:hypothetical protein
MKKKMTVIALLLSYGFAASAQRVVTVEHMTCEQAQNYAKTYKRYWKDAGPDGAIPIYPVYQLDNVNCGGRTYTRPQMERTLDDAHCIVGYYCNSY